MKNAGNRQLIPGCLNKKFMSTIFTTKKS